MTTSSFGTINIKDLVKLLTVAGKSGVQSLSIGDFRVEFRNQAPAIVASQAQVGPPAWGQTDVLEQSTANFGEEEKSSSAQVPGFQLFSDDEIKEIETAQQLIDDPSGYESDQIDAQVELWRREIAEEKSEATAV